MADCINQRLVEEALRRYLSCSTLKVESMSLEPAKVTASYSSQMYRVEVTYRRSLRQPAEKLPLFLKASKDTAEAAQQKAQRLVEEALRRYLSCSTLKVESMSLEPANVTASYSSEMYRVEVTYRRSLRQPAEKLPLFLKANKDTAEAAQQKAQVEAVMLVKVLPKAEAALRRVEPSTFRPLVPACLLHRSAPRACFLLEDLEAAGYRLTASDRPLDHRHCELLVRAYARLHAGTAYVLNTHPDCGAQLGGDIYDSRNFYLWMMTNSMCAAVANFVQTLPSYKRYAAKFEGLQNTLFQLMAGELEKKAKDTKLKVLVHGDCWKNNMMFKDSEGEVVDVRLVDFQLSHVSSPVRDLVYVLYAIAGVGDPSRLPSLLETYHSQLDALLRALGMTEAADRYPLQQLQRDVDDLVHFALFSAASCGFMITSEGSENKASRAMRDLNFKEETFYGIYDNPHCRSYMQQMIPYFEKKGVL